MDDNANALAEHGRALAEAATAALPGWVARVACARAAAAGVALDPAAVDAAGRQAAGEVGHRLRELVALDVDAQRATPLALVRTAVRWPTALLRDAGVPPVARDDFDVERFPDDLYGLTPATFADLDPSLGELAITWGAAKAWVHKRRHAPPPR